MFNYLKKNKKGNDSIDAKFDANVENEKLVDDLIKYLGGIDNLVKIDNCITRLRLEVKDTSIIDDEAIEKITLGITKSSNTDVQIVIGTRIDFIAKTIKNKKK
ncbi:PTS transporter subunit EIIB [Oceanivirga salmonicida]|uniref:PTS transporter subunit EIIB n=1 Tax=Oceanivirga salmonicida TaxID=1769291 RepID=UPI0012E2EE71|nr:PTS transporter subunit EIIB [Oceanivirga salmonicida]